MAGPAMYLEKPVTPQGYLANICRILNLECPAEAESGEQTDELRRQLRDLVEQRRPETRWPRPWRN